MRPYLIGILALVFAGHIILALLSARSAARAGAPLLAGTSLTTGASSWVLNSRVFAILSLQLKLWQSWALIALIAVPMDIGSRFRLGERGLMLGPSFVPRDRLFGYQYLGGRRRLVEFYPVQGDRSYLAKINRKVTENEIGTRLSAYFAVDPPPAVNERKEGGNGCERIG